MQCTDARFRDLVYPHLPNTAPSEDKVRFIEAVQTKPIGFSGRFWRKKEKDQAGKWVVPCFSGAVLREENIFRIVIRNNGFVWIKTRDKELKKGIEIAVVKCGASYSEVQVTPIVFKKEIHPDDHTVEYVEEVIETHQHYYLECEEGVSSPPILIGDRAKKGLKIVDFYEKASLCHLNHQALSRCLVKGYPFTLPTLARGLTSVAKVLSALKKDNKVHLDVKISNIFIDFVNNQYTLGLADFEFIDKVFSDYRDIPKDTYYFWDFVRNKVRLVTSFCDVYGFAHSLACVLWGYHELDSCEAFQETVKNISNPALIRIHSLALCFVMKVKNEDLRRAYLFKERSQDISSDKDKEIVLGLVKDEQVTPDDCVVFAEYWLKEMYASNIS